MHPVLKLSPAFREMLEHTLDELRMQPMTQSRAISGQVMKLSNFYLENPGHPTPWQEPFATPAYLSYFLPLNYIRLSAAIREVVRFLPPDSFSEIWDFGSGIGTTHWVLEDQPEIAPRPFYAVERSSEAMRLHQDLIKKRSDLRWNVQFNEKRQPAPLSLGIFSYSFLEMQNALPPLDQFSHLLIVEPSTRECGRALMQWRSKLMQKGFFPLAPCTHSEDCPLLIHSHKDWCHQRVHFGGPLWYLRIESHLPMRNKTLTYSYLLASRTVQDKVWRGAARAIGDTMKENGKTRQLICRSTQREFLSWLHKAGPVPQIPHGSLIRGVNEAERRSGELRPKAGSLEWTS